MADRSRAEAPMTGTAQDRLDSETERPRHGGLPQTSYEVVRLRKQIRRTALLGVASIAIAVSVSACGSGSSAPLAPATTLPTVAPSATPTASTTGTINFGTSVAGTQLKGKATSFKSPKTLAWVAHFGPKPNKSSVTWTLTRTRGPAPIPAVVWTKTATVSPGASTATVTLTKQELIARRVGAGESFSVKYKQGSAVVASGTFSVATTGGGTCCY